MRYPRYLRRHEQSIGAFIRAECLYRGAADLADPLLSARTAARLSPQ